MQLRVYYALRRERQFCESLACNSTVCTSFVSSAATKLRARERMLEPSGTEAELRGGLISDNVIAWHRRNCSSSDLPCPKLLIQPLLDAKDSRGAKQAVVEVESLLAASVIPSPDFETRLWRLLNAPFPTCNTFQLVNKVRQGIDVCIDDFVIDSNVTSFLDRSSYLDRINGTLKSDLFHALANCYLGCRAKRIVFERLQIRSVFLLAVD